MINIAKDDKELIKQIKSGSSTALEELVNKYYDQIFAYSYRILGSYHDASDVVQDVFISMMKAIPDYQEKNKFKSWLFTIAHNKCMNSIAVRKNHSDINLIENIHSNEDFTERYVEKNFAKDILETLPEIQKSALILKYYHDLTAREIAQITDVNIATVKSRLYQGLEKLRKIVKGG